MPSETLRPVREGFDVRRICYPCRFNWAQERRFDAYIKGMGFRPSDRQFDDFAEGRVLL
jgi:hypothetical protein